MKNLVETNKATNILCSKTKLPIFAGESMYMLYGECYHEDVAIDDLINEVTHGLYKSSEDLYDDNSDDYYFTTNYDVDTVVNDIIEQGYYYDDEGKFHEYNGQMKTFKIPVTWEVYSTINVEAETLEEALEIFDKYENTDGGYVLPTDPDYVDGSFKREDDIEFIKLCNK